MKWINTFQGKKTKQTDNDYIKVKQGTLNSLMKNQDKYDKLIASNLNEDIKDFIATSHSNVMNNYEIVGNDKLQNVLDEMNFNYFWDIGKKICTNEGAVYFFVYTSGTTGKPVIKIVTPTAMNFRGNKLQDIRFNFKKLKYLFDNETAQVIIKTQNGKIEANTEAHSFNDSLEIKEGKKIEEIVVAKDIEQIPIFGFPNNSNWASTVTDELNNLINEYIVIKDQQVTEGQLATTKLYLTDLGQDPFLVQHKEKEFKHNSVITLNGTTKDNRDFMDYSPNQVDKQIQSKKDFWDMISKFTYLEREATSKGAQQTDNEISQTNSQVLNYFENKIQIWNKLFQDMINCICRTANLGEATVTLKLSTRMDNQLNPPNTMGANMNRSEDDN